MKNKKILIIGLLFVIGIVLIFLSFNNKKLEQKNDIEKVLESKIYVNLPESAKKYIKEVYENTGEILKVEGNKEENVPYLNPSYIDYLEYIEDVELGKQDKNVSYEVIPDELIVDYINTPTSNASNESLPSSYDLRNVEGKNYTTPLKDQGREGLCWAYATASHLESKIMMDKNEPYDKNKTILMSPKYYDYAASTAINDYEKMTKIKSSYGELKTGGSFSSAELLAIQNLGTVSTDWNNTVDITSSSMEASKIFKFGNSIYDVDNTIHYPYLDLTKLDLSNNNDYIKYQSNINGIKKLAIDNGGAYIDGYIAGTYGCEVTKDNGDVFIGHNELCHNTGLHAEQLIGWDDNFEYQYCKDKKGTKNNIYDITDEDCLENSVVTGKGAWLIRNSWGNIDKYAYYWIPYLSPDLYFYFFTELSQKNWENYYSFDRIKNNQEDKTLRIEYSPTIPQKVIKLKIYVHRQNERLKVFFGNNNDSLDELTEINTTYPGYYSIDLSDKNIIINPNNDYFIQVFDNDNNNITKYETAIDDIFLFTENYNSFYKAQIDTSYISLTDSEKNGYYKVRVDGFTENIEEGSLLDFKVLNEKGQEVKNITYDNNEVFANHIFANIYIPKNNNINKDYKIQVLYQGNVQGTSKRMIFGSGTKDDPWQIDCVEDLELLSKYSFDYFEIVNDIDLENKEREPIRRFSGHLNGNNHVIKNLNINDSGTSSGFFDFLLDNAEIENIIFQNVNIKGDEFLGTLAGSVNGENIIIKNISVISGNIGPRDSIYSYPYSGGIIGHYTVRNNNVISNLYNSANIVGDQSAAGIIAYIDNKDNNILSISNVINKGNITSNFAAAGLVGLVYSQNMNINNGFQYGSINGKRCSDDIICETYNNDSLNVSNVYYTGDSSIFNVSSATINNVRKMTAVDIANADYSDWNNFYDNFNNETIQQIKRIPMLKNVPFEYIEYVANVTILLNETKSIFSYVYPESDIVRNSLTYSVEDNNILEIDSNGLIKPKNIGSTIINISSSYDGFKGNIKIQVNRVVDENNPILINNKNDLDLLREYPEDYFEITKDIDLENEEWEPIESFSGHLKGNNHVIKNLSIQNPTMGGSGFFKQIFSGADIKDIIFEDVNIKVMSWGGILSGVVSGDNINISNISVINGNLDKDNNSIPLIGGIIGKYNHGNDNTIQNLYNGANINNDTGQYGAGIIANIVDSNNIGLTIKNIMNRGRINAQNAGGLIGNINTSNITLYNAFQLGEINGSSKKDDIICNISNGTTYLKNIYHVNDSVFDNSSNNVYKKTIFEIANADYSSWNDFNNNFKHDTIDDAKRIPLLKNVDIEYTKLKTDKIDLEINQEYNIYDLIDTTNPIIKKDINYNIGISIYQNQVLEDKYNGVIKAINPGPTDIYIENKYDGFSKYINVFVNGNIICEAGMFLPANKNHCWLCEAGNYCEGGSFNYSDIQQGKTSCPSGYYSDIGAKSNTECFVEVFDGHYKTNENESNISKCSAGTYKEAHRSYYKQKDSCNMCAQGSYSNEEAKSCTVCGNGKTTSGAGKSFCDVDCSNKTGVSKWTVPSWNNNIVSNLCKIDECATGYSKDSTNNKCTNDGITCEAGKYLPANSTTCMSCPSGSYCEGGTFIYSSTEQGKKSCPIGYTSDSEAKTDSSCFINIEEGKYKTNKTESNIAICSVGTYKEAHRSYYNQDDSCNECEGRTKYSSEGSSACSVVDNGYYSIGCDSSNNKCTGQNKCLAGNYCVNGVSTPCAQGSYSGIGASSCIVCSEGSTSGIGSSSCDLNCNNNLGVSKWKIASWENNEVNNLCRVDSCESDYELDATNNKCVPKEKEDKEYEIKDGYILNISKLTNLEGFKDYLEVADDEIIKVFDNNGNELENNERIFTGSITKIFKGDDLVEQYTNIIVGDSNKDGDMDLSDIALTYKKVMNDDVEDELIFLSSNVNDDNILDISDVAKMYSYFMNDMEL